MKLFLKLLTRFIFAALLATALFTLVIFIVAVGRTGLDTVRGESMVGMYALHAVYRGLLPGWMFGSLYVLFSALHHLKRSSMPLIPVCACAAVVLYGLLTAGSVLPGNHFQNDRLYLLRPRSGLIYRETGVGHRALIAGTVDGLIMEDVLLYKPDSQDPAWQIFPRLLIDPSENTVVVPGDTNFPLHASPTASWSLFRLPRELQALADDFSRMQRTLFDSGWLARGVIAVVMSVSFFSLWILVRFSRWPLINAIVVMGAVRVLVWGSAVVLQPESVAFFEVVLGNVQPWIMITIVYVAAAVVFLTGGLLQSPFKTWSEEVRS